MTAYITLEVGKLIYDLSTCISGETVLNKMKQIACEVIQAISHHAKK